MQNAKVLLDCVKWREIKKETNAQFISFSPQKFALLYVTEVWELGTRNETIPSEISGALRG